MLEQNTSVMDQNIEPEKPKSFLRRVNDRLQSRLEKILPAEKVGPLRSSLESARKFEVAGLRSDKPYVDRIYSPIRKLLEEPGATISMATMYLGELSVKGAEEHGRKSPIGDFMVNAPIAMEAAVELRKFIEVESESLSENNTDTKQKYEVLAKNYGIGTDSRIFEDPKMVENLRKSFLLWPAYGEFVKYTGIPIQAGLSALFVLQPEVNEFIAKNAVSVDLASVATTGALMIWRASQEIAAIKEKGYNPDFMQTAPIILTSRMENGELKRDIKKWVWIGEAIDLAKVQLVYTLPFAGNEHLLAAAIMTNVTDMLYHGVFNYAFRKDIIGKVRGNK